MQPARGARLTLRLESDAGAEVRYRAEISTPEGHFRGVARVAPADGDVAFQPWAEGEPPAWLIERVRALLRAQWRSNKLSNAPWPRRITRWRPSPDGPAKEDEP